MKTGYYWVEDGILNKKEDEKQKLKMGGGSWTIPLNRLTENISAICYLTEVGKYCISKEIALSSGFVRKFKDEEKLVVPIKNWNLNKRGVQNAV